MTKLRHERERCPDLRPCGRSGFVLSSSLRDPGLVSSLSPLFLPPRPRAGIFAQPPGRGIPQKLFSPLHRCGPESQISERMRRVGSKWIWGNKFSAAEQWAEFHNDEALGLVFESERERERERQRNNVAEVVSLLQAFVITKGIFLL